MNGAPPQPDALKLIDHGFVLLFAIGLPALELMLSSPKRMEEVSRTSRQRVGRYWPMTGFELLLAAFVLGLWVRLRAARWKPLMVLHAAMDINGQMVALRVMQTSEPPNDGRSGDDCGVQGG